MLTMAEIQYIKYLYENQEKSLREIAKITGRSFQTVQKYAYMENWSPEKPPEVKAEKYKVLGAYIPIIDRWLEEDRKVPRKQRHTATRVYRRLAEEEGYTGSYSSVKKYYRKKKYLLGLQNRTEEGYVPLLHPAGAAQLDFGETVCYDGSGKLQTKYVLIVSFPHSNKAYAQLMPGQNQECLLEGMKRIFRYIGGVPAVIRMDNMSSAVAAVLPGHERKLTEGFARFALHYRFGYEFCTPAAGNEKGNVENKVGYIRRNLFVPVPTVTDPDAFNRELLERCERDGEREHYRQGKDINTLWEEDRLELLALPEYDYAVFRYETATVNKYGMVRLDGNRYSASPNLMGEKVQIKASFDRVDIYLGESRIASHRRCYGKNQDIYDWTGYLSLLVKKPEAAVNSAVFPQMPENWQAYLNDCPGKERRNALSILRDMVRDGYADRCGEILETASVGGRCDCDSLRQCYYRLTGQSAPPEPLLLGEDASQKLELPDLKIYNRLTTGGDTE